MRSETSLFRLAENVLRANSVDCRSKKAHSEKIVVRTDSPQDDTRQDQSRTRRRFVLAASLVCLWCIGLGALSLLTANPITLNRDQILGSVDVVTAVVEDPRSGQVRVEKSWKDIVHDKHLTLSNLSQLQLTANERLLIPVIRVPRSWQVAPSKLPHEPPLVYPATEESERQLRQLLKTGRLP